MTENNETRRGFLQKVLKEPARAVGVVAATLATSTSTEQEAQAGPFGIVGDLATRTCCTLIRQCAVPDGALRAVSSNNTVLVEPYFSNQGALGLLAGLPISPNKTLDMGIVGKWLMWFAGHQDPNTGIIRKHEGNIVVANGQTTVNYTSVTDADAIDSAAATHLEVVNMYNMARKTLSVPERNALDALYPPAVILVSAKRSFNALKLVTDPTDGLTYAKLPTVYPFKLLADNLETSAGLTAAISYFTDAGALPERVQATAMKNAIRISLPGFKRNDGFAWVKNPNNTFTVDTTTVYPGLYSQLKGIAFLNPDTALFNALSARYRPDINVDNGTTQNNNIPAGAPPELWLSAGIAARPDQAPFFNERTATPPMFRFGRHTHISRLGPSAMVEALGAGQYVALENFRGGDGRA